MNKLVCPACRGAMQTLIVAGVELDACTECAGLWFDWGELGRVAQVPMQLERLRGTTHRSCPRCRISMEPARLPPAITVETCGRCQGFYLDAGELDALAKRPIPILTEQQKEARAKEEARRETLPGPQFVCVACQQRFPTTQGHFFRGGLACEDCTPQVQTTRRERLEANGHVQSVFGRNVHPLHVVLGLLLGGF